MKQITSREELELWLKNKPADWAQVIAARAALRALPYAFSERAKSQWLQDFASAVFRCLALAWAAHSFSNNKLNIYGATAEAEDAAAYAAAAPDIGDPAATTCADAAAHAAAAVAAAVSDEPVVNNPLRYALDCVNLSALTFSFAGIGGLWENTNQDCVWIEEYPVEAFSAVYYAGQHIWPVEEPVSWQADWQTATTRLLTLDPTYQVWIDWYNRRIEGHDAAFNIPGDVDRVHDKAILARLADATDEDFWGKGATYVNTTLQSWIDEAREQAAIDYVTSGAPLNLGSVAELAARGELLTRFAEMEAELAKAQDQIASLSETGHGGMGHNQPDHAPSLLQEEMALLRQRVVELETTVAAMVTAFAKLNSAVPVANAIVAEPAQLQAKEAVAELFENAPKLNRWGRMMQALEDATSPEVRKGFDNAAGVTLVAAIVGTPYYIYTTLPNAIAEFLHYLFTVWFAILPG